MRIYSQLVSPMDGEIPMLASLDLRVDLNELEGERERKNERKKFGGPVFYDSCAGRAFMLFFTKYLFMIKTLLLLPRISLRS